MSSQAWFLRHLKQNRTELSVLCTSGTDGESQTGTWQWAEKPIPLLSSCESPVLQVKGPVFKVWLSRKKSILWGAKHVCSGGSGHTCNTHILQITWKTVLCQQFQNFPSLTQTVPITLNTRVSSNCSKMCQTTSNSSPVKNKSPRLTSSSRCLGKNTPTCQLPEASAMFLCSEFV